MRLIAKVAVMGAVLTGMLLTGGRLEPLVQAWPLSPGDCVEMRSQARRRGRNPAVLSCPGASLTRRSPERTSC